MTTLQEVLLSTLEELGKEEFENFKWFLYQEGVLEDFKSIPKRHLEEATRINTVDQMVQTYGTMNVLKVTEKILMKMNKINLVRKITRSIKEPTGVSEVKLQPNTADTEPDPELMEGALWSHFATSIHNSHKISNFSPILTCMPTFTRFGISSTFTPEMQTESRRILYRFRCTYPGEFQCAETGLVFVLTQGAELQYSIVQWDESLLKPTGKVAAGPLYDIRCSEDAAVHQLHFPHCETKDVLSIDGLLSVAHFTDDGMSILKPLQITDTHVVVAITHLSLFGLIWDPVKRRLSRRVKGQVLLFLRPPMRGPRTLDVFLLQKNIPPSQVAALKENAEYIEISANCSLISGWKYSLHCKPMGLKIQPECANFERDFGPHFHPTFEVFLETNTDLVTLTVQDHKETDVWKRDVYLKDSRRDTEQSVQPQSVQPQSVQPQSVQPQSVQPQSVQPEDWLLSVWTELIDGLSETNVNQILDRLYQERVFNAQEMKFIRAQIGADKARELIEGVQQKGFKAGLLVKAVLHEIDPFLFKKLHETKKVWA